MTAAILTNIVFWSGLAIGGVAFAALLEVTGAEWAGPLRLTAERFRWFLPVSFLGFVILMWRSGAVYPWARQSPDTAWFARWLVALRVDLLCAVVFISAFVFCRASERARSGRTPASRRRATASAIVFLVVYAFGYSLITVDAVMSLEPRWTSTLFPAYVFTGNVYCGIAAVAALAAWNVEMPVGIMTSARSRDMANLLVATALFWLYLFWSQFLVIWYGNLTSEVGFLMARLDGLRGTAWMVLAMCCAVPSIVFVPRWGKRADAIKIVAPLILVGMWFERWILVAPDVPARSPLLALLITAIFAAVFLLSIYSSVTRYNDSRSTGSTRALA
jgi:hypothetical protein